MNTHPVVVGIDGSGSAERSARWAAAEAARRGVPLRLVHAYDVPLVYTQGVVAPRQVLDVLREEGESWLRVAGEAASAAAPGVGIELVAVQGDAVPTLIEQSRDATLVALGSRGLGGFGALLVGSTAVGVTGRAHCPVVVVREDSVADGPVVVGVSGTPEGEGAIGFAFQQASVSGRELVAVHAWADSVIDILRDEGSTVWDFAPAELHAKEILAERLAGWPEKYPDVALNRVVVHEHPARALLQHAETASLLVVGTHGRGALAGTVLGSVSQQLLHHATGAVAVIPV